VLILSLRNSYPVAPERSNELRLLLLSPSWYCGQRYFPISLSLKMLICCRLLVSEEDFASAIAAALKVCESLKDSKCANALKSFMVRNSAPYPLSFSHLFHLFLCFSKLILFLVDAESESIRFR
jgi:hypothetical protein